ncbi:MAG: hypothetical protein IT337_16340 [Thermomicrobiales bacterium]|nr:hypothetical protein [Thermomicrobiales bacterium]
MRDAVVQALREAYGDDWGRDEEANLRFSVEVEALVTDIDGLLLIGDPEIGKDEVTIRMWVDRPVPDLMTADALAFTVFGRVAEEVFFAERRFEAQTLCYPFVTGSSRRGHLGELVLAGPHAADFATRFRERLGGARFHA